MKKANIYLILGAVISGFISLLIIVGMFYLPYDPNALNSDEKKLAPSLSHLLGTDQFGRDIFSRVVDGAGTTFIISVCVVAIGCIIGVIIGALCGYYGGIVDTVITRICDSITAFPSFLLALVVVSIIGSGKYNIIFALGILFIPSFARVVRAEYVKERDKNYIKSARLSEVSDLRIIFIHILPNIKGVLLPAVTIGFNNAVLSEAGMSFLGIGIQPPDASLGSMLQESQTFLSSSPWYAYGTGGMIILMILGFSLLGEGISRKNSKL